MLWVHWKCSARTADLLEGPLLGLAGFLLVIGILTGAGSLLVLWVSSWEWPDPDQNDLQQVNQALASPEPIAFVGGVYDWDIAFRWMHPLENFRHSPRGKQFRIVEVSTDVLARALKVPTLPAKGCVVLFVKNRTEGLLYHDGKCGVPFETYEVGANWLEGAPGSDRIPRARDWDDIPGRRDGDEIWKHFQPESSFKITPVAARTTAMTVAAGPAPVAMPLTAQEERELQANDAFRECENCPEMVVVPAGAFTMGARENHRHKDEAPQHVVTIGRPIAIGKLHVTRDQFAAFVRETGYGASSKCNIREHEFPFGRVERTDRSWQNPDFWQGGLHPVVCVSWDDARAYIGWLAKKTGKPYRLLSEAEWEYAARGRTQPGAYPYFWFGDDDKSKCLYANTFNYACNDGYEYTSQGGHYEANSFGLYDMAGNAWQWTADCYHDSYDGAPVDGSAWIAGDCSPGRVVRGGSWDRDPSNYGAEVYGAATRYKYTGANDSIGFRVARTTAP
jgi:formylglycine-generating enzyme required for sulfatase activity